MNENSKEEALALRALLERLTSVGGCITSLRCTKCECMVKSDYMFVDATESAFEGYYCESCVDTLRTDLDNMIIQLKENDND